MEEITDSMKTEEENSQVEKRRKRIPPLLALTFVRKATKVDSPTSVEELCHRIYGGVLMNDNKLKFWVDEVHDKNCFLLLAKELTITWIHDEQYWVWINEKEKCYGGEVEIPVAELKKVIWLEVFGTFKTILLSPKTTYEVAFVAKKINNSRGWPLPLTLNLTLPDKTTQGRIENLAQVPLGKWIDILVGTFVTTPENVGKIRFSFHETSQHWKSGLLVKGVALRPKD